MEDSSSSLKRNVEEISSEMKRSKKKRRKRRKNADVKETTPELVEEAKEYLEMWSGNRVQWKFRKAKQAWILRWMYHTQYVNKSMFKLVLPYLTGLQVCFEFLFSVYIYMNHTTTSGKCEIKDV